MGKQKNNGEGCGGDFHLAKGRNKHENNGITLFASAEEAWFWFIQAQKARQSGAKISANQGTIIRPCEPADILKILHRLQRHRRLDMNHFRVMRHYGDRMLAPDPYHAREMTASSLWGEAMEILEDVLIAKDIVMPRLPCEIIDFNAKRQEASRTW